MKKTQSWLLAALMVVFLSPACVEAVVETVPQEDIDECGLAHDHPRAIEDFTDITDLER